MIRYECDKCGKSLGANDAHRFIIKLEVYAAAGHLELTEESSADPGEELDNILRTLASANPDDVEDRTYRSYRFDVCDDCRKIIMQRPLG